VACHTVTPDGGHRAGPRFTGCSAACRRSSGLPLLGGPPDSDLIWTEETVARLFEVGPDVMVPGSKMPLQHMPSSADRAALVAY
jgi:cytochrome c